MANLIEDAWFMQGMVKATTDMWLKGWDERNGGNVSFRLLDEDLEPYRQSLNLIGTCPIGEKIAGLGGQHFLQYALAGACHARITPR